MHRRPPLRHSVARPSDALDLIVLYQKSAAALDADPIFLDVRRLNEALRSPSELWLIGHRGDSIVYALDLFIDRSQRMARLGHLVLSPEEEDPDRVLTEIFSSTIEFVRLEIGGIDLLYTTTSTLTLKQQVATLALGFKILGIFPNFKGVDDTQLNGLTGYYFDQVLHNGRKTDLSLHPVVHPFFEITRKECGLDPLPVATLPEGNPFEGAEPLPTLEVIEAPLFVRRRFEALKSDQALGMNFYPFQVPDTLITDADQRIEIFVGVQAHARFAMIVGEHIRVSVDPAQLYGRILKLLHDRGISYVEVINDAADSIGNDCIYRAGFTPCAYFPGLKEQAGLRRDYVVFGKGWEYHVRPRLDLPKTYIEYFKQYYRLERRNFYPRSLDSHS